MKKLGFVFDGFENSRTWGRWSLKGDSGTAITLGESRTGNYAAVMFDAEASISPMDPAYVGVGIILDSLVDVRNCSTLVISFWYRVIDYYGYRFPSRAVRINASCSYLNPEGSWRGVFLLSSYDSSKIWQQFEADLIGTRYTIFFNKKYNLVGHLFQDRFKSIMIDFEEYFWQVSRYIPLNPVKDGLVEKPEGYKWSSYPILIEEVSPIKSRFYSYFEKRLIEILIDKKEFFKRFFPEYERKPKQAIKNYKKFVEEGVQTKIWQEKKWREHDLV